jgi:hypothetical protein
MHDRLLVELNRNINLKRDEVLCDGAGNDVSNENGWKVCLLKTN